MATTGPGAGSTEVVVVDAGTRVVVVTPIEVVEVVLGDEVVVTGDRVVVVVTPAPGVVVAVEPSPQAASTRAAASKTGQVRVFVASSFECTVGRLRRRVGFRFLLRG
jgi:hypothetical protein